MLSAGKIDPRPHTCETCTLQLNHICGPFDFLVGLRGDLPKLATLGGHWPSGQDEPMFSSAMGWMLLQPTGVLGATKASLAVLGAT